MATTDEEQNRAEVEGTSLEQRLRRHQRGA